jgi:uncharacterized membrane protein YqiK
MNMGNMISYLIITGVILFAFIMVGVIIARLYRRSTKEQSFVRTGFGGQAVIMNGGALVLPVLHELIWVNMNTLRLEVKREKQDSLITKDKMRVDVGVEFYVRVNPTEEAIAAAAQTLGARTCMPMNYARSLKVNLSPPCVPVLHKWTWRKCTNIVPVLCKAYNLLLLKI